MDKFYKYLFLFCTGGTTYISIEIIYRGFSHWTMFVLAGFLFVTLGLLNEVFSWETPLLLQILIGTILATLGELGTGIIVNIILKWNVWDYSDIPFNILGQICPQFTLIWIALVTVAIILDDYLRYCIFGEEKPKYRII